MDSVFVVFASLAEGYIVHARSGGTREPLLSSQHLHFFAFFPLLALWNYKRQAYYGQQGKFQPHKEKMTI